MSEEPICHLVWLQGRRAADDVEDYYEVARPGDKSADGSDPFPVYSKTPSNSEPVFWYRPVSEDGGYEGPLHANSAEFAAIPSDKRDHWVPLIAALSTSTSQP